MSKFPERFNIYIYKNGFKNTFLHLKYFAFFTEASSV